MLNGLARTFIGYCTSCETAWASRRDAASWSAVKKRSAAPGSAAALLCACATEDQGPAEGPSTKASPRTKPKGRRTHLFIAKGDERIDPRCAPRGEVRGDERKGEKCTGDNREGRCVERRDAEQQAFEIFRCDG